MRNYEILFLIHPDQSDQVPAMNERYQQIVSKKNGKVHRQEDWGRRPLAYSINDIRKAHYLLMNVECEPEQIAELENTLRFNDAVMRYLLISSKCAVTESSPMMQPKSDKKDKEDQGFRQRRKSCAFSGANMAKIDYKNIDIIKKYVSETGKIIPSRVTATSAKAQRHLATAIKRARLVALLPYCDRHQ